MRNLQNSFKAALGSGTPQIGLWLGLAHAYSAEICAAVGFDWLLIDGEHAPNDLTTILAQLQAVAPYRSHPVVRPPSDDPIFIKRLLDIGVQTLLVPMIETREQAEALVRSTRYPPDGFRGVGSALARAARWGGVPSYLQRANDEICVVAQIETAVAINNIGEIAGTEGIDAVFIGTSDLAADLGYPGNPGHTDVQAMVKSAVESARAAGKPCGFLTGDARLAARYRSWGCAFIAVGIDISLLSQAAQELAARFKRDEPHFIPSP